MTSSLRVHPRGSGEIQEQRDGVWVDVSVWLCPSAKLGGPRPLILLRVGEPAPAGSELVEHPQRLLEGMMQVSRAVAQRAAEIAQLDATARFLLDFLCLLEPDDRLRWLLYQLVADLWEDLGPGGALGALDAALDRLLGHGLITTQCDHVDEAQYFQVPDDVEKAVRTDISAERTERILNFVGRAWAAKFSNEEALPTRDTVRSGIGASVYLLRVGREALAFDVLEQRVLPVARRTGEQVPVLAHLDRLAQWLGRTDIIERVARLRAGT